MVTFKKNYKDFNRLDYGIFQNGPISLYYKKELLKTDLSWLRGKKYKIIEVDSGEWTNENFLSNLLDALEMESHKQHQNMDCLNDCIGDMDSTRGSGIIIVFWNFDKFYSNNKETALILLDILAMNSFKELLFGGRLFTILQSDDPKIAVPGVGAMPIVWNPQEWLNKSRGV